MNNSYRSTDQIRAEADCEYHVYWASYNNEYYLDKVIANDHEDAHKQILRKPECVEVLLVLKGDFLVLWQA